MKPPKAIPSPTDDLRRRRKAFGRHSSIRLAADVDAWLRQYCIDSGKTYRGTIEDALNLYRRQLDPAAPADPSPALDRP